MIYELEDNFYVVMFDHFFDQHDLDTRSIVLDVSASIFHPDVQKVVAVSFIICLLIKGLLYCLDDLIDSL